MAFKSGVYGLYMFRLFPVSDFEFSGRDTKPAKCEPFLTCNEGCRWQDIYFFHPLLT